MSENQTKNVLVPKKEMPAYCVTTVYPNYEWFGRYGFPPYVKVFDPRTVTYCITAIAMLHFALQNKIPQPKISIVL